jgi:hypothetical protein
MRSGATITRACPRNSPGFAPKVVSRSEIIGSKTLITWNFLSLQLWMLRYSA